MKIKALALAAASLLAIAPATIGWSKPIYGNWGYDPTAMDSGVKPGDDFFAFVNGGWFKRTSIEPDRTFAGIDSVLNDQIDKDVHDIVEDMAKNPDQSGRIGQQVGDFYASWMDQPAIEARGFEPARPYLARIAAVKDRAGLADLFGSVEFNSPVPIFIESDPKAPTRYAVFTTQGGLGMPSRDYYLLEGAKYDAFRTAYRNYVSKILSLAGESDADARADRIIALETAIAKAQWTPERRRDVKATYNPMGRVQLARLAPQLQWARLLQSEDLGKVQTVIVREPSAIAAIGKLVASTPLTTSTTSTPSPQCCPRRSMTRGSISMARRSPTFRRSAIAGSGASTWSMARSAKASGKSTSSGIIRRKATNRCTSWSATSSPRSRTRSITIHGWTSRPARLRWRSSRASIRASATRSNISIIRRWW